MDISREQYIQLRKQGLTPEKINILSGGTLLPEQPAQAPVQQKAEEPGYVSRVAGEYSDIGKRLTEDITKGAERASQYQAEGKPLMAGVEHARAGLRTVGAVAEGALAPITEAPGVKQALDWVGQKFGESDAGKKVSELIQKNPEMSQDIMDTVNILTLGVGGAAEKPLTTAAQKAVTGVEKAATKTTDLLTETGEKISKKASEKSVAKAEPAIGRVIQGEGTTKEIDAAARAFSSVDTTGVKTTKDLISRFDEAGKIELTKVDEAFSKNPTVKKLSDWKYTEETVGGTPVTQNFVADALGDLKKLYTQTGDKVGLQEIDDVSKLARSDGLTYGHVNNLARKYSSEFSKKAYSAKGDPLTNINAQRIENVRRGLKDTAREGLTDDAAKIADKSYSDITNTKTLLENRAKSIEKLKRKMADRGFLQDATEKIINILDVATLGTVKGVAKGVAKGAFGFAGKETMNPAALEKALKKELGIINKALKAKDKLEMENIINMSSKTIKK